MIDLHCHSNFSDGKHSPEDLMSMALKAGLKILALTDHDTVDGLPAIHQAAKDCGSVVKIINGIEFSTRWKKHEIHILGLNINPAEPKLVDLINLQRERRRNRAINIAERLSLCGVLDAYAKACEIAGHEYVSRPHFAQVLINEGKTKTIQSGFSQYLGRGCSAFVPTLWLSVEEAVKGILNAGGSAVIAHPLKYSLTRTKLHELILDFKEAGGTALEVVSGEMMSVQINELALLCRKHELFASSGSDFHGEGLSRRGLGRQQALPVSCIPLWDQWVG